jgi:CTP synthase (UTP-ammonia lyase)
MFDTANIVLVGKYTDFKDSYTSVVKALEHSAFRVHRKLILQVCGAALQTLCVWFRAYVVISRW